MSKFAGLAIPRAEKARMYLLHPTTRQPLMTSDNQAGYIDVYSPKSEKAEAERQRIKTRNTVRQQAQKGASRILVGEAEADAVNMLAVCTADWLLVGTDGAIIDVPCTEANARELFASADHRWIREAVEAFRNDEANFIGATAPTNAAE